MGVVFQYSAFVDELTATFDTLKEKCHAHPELFGMNESVKEGDEKRYSWMRFMKKASSQHIRSRKMLSVLIYQI